MGICLDTDQQNRSQVFEDGDAHGGKWRGEAGLLSTPPDGHFPMQNVSPVKFEPPTVPVIFVLGGPGSGKVTHCDNLMQEKKGITHINMTDLLQQYALGNDMQDFSLLSSKTVAEVLMLEMKMSPNAKTFLVSGYPRNMRDVVEYSEKIQIVNGVILVSWKQEVLERQIDYGAQLGHVILSLARMELRNFYRNVMPVAEYFDRSGVLVEVNGERNPSDVYIDFREAVMEILGFSKSGSREPASQSLEAEVKVERTEPISASPKTAYIAPISSEPKTVISKTAIKPRKGLPTFIWVIGGPGSNKSSLCIQAVRNMPNWAHISIGNLLRTMSTSNMLVKEAIVGGEMVSQDVVMQLIEQQVLLNRDSDGIIIDGFPRDLNQVQEFKSKFGQEPPLILLDCSKLQLGRGKLDDTVPAFRRRLELFREVTLPVLKIIDNDSRLITINGDTDVPSVQQEFSAAIYQLMRQSHHKDQDSLKERQDSSSNNWSYINSNHDEHQKKSRIPNNLSKTPIENGISTISNHTKKQKDKFVAQKNKMVNGVRNHSNKKDIDTKVNQVVKEGNRIANGVINSTRQNGHIAHAGDINTTQRLFHNGVAHVTNGIPPVLNRVAPAPSNSDCSDKVTRTNNKINNFHEDLYM